MKLILFFFTVFFSSCVFSQENNPAPEFKKIQMGVSFSPDYSFRTLINNSGSSSVGGIVIFRNDGERAKLGYTGGLNLIYNFSKKIGLETGLQFSNKGYQYNLDDITFGDMIDPRRGFVYASQDQIKAAKFIYNYYYLDIPLKVNFTFGKKKIRFITTAGITTNVFLLASDKEKLTYQDGTHNKNKSRSTYAYNTINLSPMISAGIDWKFNDKNSLRIEPTFRYGILKINNDPVSGYLWNAGLNISYYFGLK